ncbi:MAG: tRNA modification GTPase, partial [Gammaproteobacteria bacterium]|nr:tRNA modification GTPase [Gammaproteobacteria bacterium]
AALRSLRGDFSAAVHELTAALTELRMYVEAAIDFPEEEVDFLGDNEIQTRLKDIKEKFSTLDSKASQGALMHDGLTVVIAGKPNAGKSSLLNKLAGYDAAIVTDIPGTTRDLLREKMHIDGLPLHIIDTAGLRDSGDAIEVEGQRRARAEMEQADRVLLVIDDSVENEEVNPSALHAFPESLPVTVVRNKIDLSGQAAGELPGNANSQFAISAKTGAGLAQLRQHLKDAVGYQQAGSDTFMARRRHLDALRKAREHVRQGEHALQNAKAGELLAEELRLAQRDLSEITGEFSSDDLLGQIFSSFCIGK